MSIATIIKGLGIEDMLKPVGKFLADAVSGRLWGSVKRGAKEIANEEVEHGIDLDGDNRLGSVGGVQLSQPRQGGKPAPDGVGPDRGGPVRENGTNERAATGRIELDPLDG
jgi:hypothetical protein